MLFLKFKLYLYPAMLIANILKGVQMKGLKKILTLTSALGVLSSPLMALEVYNEDDKKLEVYGSIRVFVGGAGYSQDHSSGGNAIYGLQTNSRLGVKTTMGKFSAKVELGAVEKGIASSAAATAPGFRHLWGEYDFGKGGKLLAGKTDTPTILDGFITISDITGTDDGQGGYGALPAANRKVQIRYTIAGLAIALVQDTLGAGMTQNDSVPRIALGWQHKGESIKLHIGGSYKYYNLEGTSHTDSNNRLSNSAFHVLAAMEKDFQKSYLTAIINYGMNADLYSEQRTDVNLGLLNHSSISFDKSFSGRDVHRAGVYLEHGCKVSDSIKAVIGLGYQATWTNKSSDGLINTYMVMAQLPYKLNGHVTITPQVGWYAYSSSKNSTLQDSDGKTLLSGYDNNAVVALVRFKYDF